MHVSRTFVIAIFLMNAWISAESRGSSFHRQSQSLPVDAALQDARQRSAEVIDSPKIDVVVVNGREAWRQGQTAPATLRVGDSVSLIGSGFGQGVDIDFSRIVIGNTRVMERDLVMYKGAVHLLKELFYEKPRTIDSWPKEIRAWSPTRIEFVVPRTASRGPLRVLVQKRIGTMSSIPDPTKPHVVYDPLTERIEAKFDHPSDVVSELGDIFESEPVPVGIDNPEHAKMVREGEAIYWAYDNNIGLVHELSGVGWDSILSGKSKDPVTGLPADPETLFGAFRIDSGEVPEVARTAFYFDPYPIPIPLKPLLRPRLLSGWTRPSGFIGRVYAESIHPVTNLKGNWAGENCASCHTQRITYERTPGNWVTKFFPGLPNPQWSEKWTTLESLKGVVGREPGPDGEVAEVDKRLLLYHLPPGLTENALSRAAGTGSRYQNDYLFAPVAIPTITRHTPLRRVLARTEMIAGFEGSYIHSQEPDGAIGAMTREPLQALTAYMAELDNDQEILRKLSIYRKLKARNQLHWVGGLGEAAFLRSEIGSFPMLKERLEAGQRSFERNCLSCHQSNSGTWTDERMFRLDEVGSYFSPSIFHREVLSIRTAYLRDLFWVEKRGLLHDGHVKTLEDLVDPERCREGSVLYEQYYRLSPSTFHVPKGNAAQERALRRHAYFVDVPWDKASLYWDFQKMRREFGMREFGMTKPAPLPASPHPWCARYSDEIEDLTLYLILL